MIIYFIIGLIVAILCGIAQWKAEMPLAFMVILAPFIFLFWPALVLISFCCWVDEKRDIR